MKDKRKLAALPIIVNIFISFVFILISAAVIRRDASAWNIAAVCAAYIIVSALSFFLWYVIAGSRTSPADTAPMLGSMTVNFLTEFKMPVAISDEGGKIIWYNKAFENINGEDGSLCGKRITELSGIDPSLFSSDTAEEQLNAFGHSFSLSCYPFDFDKKGFIISTWDDLSEVEELYDRLFDADNAFAYIVIDNLEELMQYVQTKYRSAAADIEQLLKDWADSVDGVLKEYERDKFIFIFPSGRLNDYIESKFDILDKIRNVRVGDGNLPVTISVGVANIAGSPAEKEKAASAALDMALQRGGDQAVVKTDSGMEYFGGKSQTVQKRTRVRSRVAANELAMQIAKSENILIMGHASPDFDSIGASLGIYRLAAFCGVNANIIADTTDPNFLRCRDRLFSLDEYRDNDIFISPTEAQDSLTSETLTIVVDVNNRGYFASPDIFDASAKTVVIDHHRKTEEFSQQPVIAYIDPAASSTCEIVSEMLETALPDGTLKREEAEIMLAGIMLDTKNFARNTGSRTFGASLYLRNEGANPASAELMFTTSRAVFMRQRDYENRVTFYKGKIAITYSSDKEDGEISRTPSDSYDRDRDEKIAMAKAADKLISISGVTATFVLRQEEDYIILSARSRGDVNVQLILEKLGGGGHFDSAGAKVRGKNMQEVLISLRDAIDAQLSEPASNQKK